MRKKVVSVLLTAAMTATMLAGCGNKQTADSQLGESYEETMAAVQSEEAATKKRRKPQHRQRSWIIPNGLTWYFICLVTHRQGWIA